jgi:hypothetical protein
MATMRTKAIRSEHVQWILSLLLFQTPHDSERVATFARCNDLARLEEARIWKKLSVATDFETK